MCSSLIVTTCWKSLVRLGISGRVVPHPSIRADCSSSGAPALTIPIARSPPRWRSADAQKQRWLHMHSLAHILPRRHGRSLLLAVSVVFAMIVATGPAHAAAGRHAVREDRDARAPATATSKAREDAVFRGVVEHGRKVGSARGVATAIPFGHKVGSARGAPTAIPFGHKVGAPTQRPEHPLRYGHKVG